MKKIGKLSIIIASLLAVACDPFQTKIGDEVSYYESAEIQEFEFSDTLKVATWNIKFGGGRIDFFFDCHGSRVIMQKSEVLENLDALAEKIREIDPDILFVQEVDINAKRSAFVNQVQYLLDRTPFNYAVYASQWKSNYIPRRKIGIVDSGNAIFSKWELANGKRIALPLIDLQSAIVRYFYLKRNILEVEISTQVKPLKLLTTHTAAYAKDDTKKRQLEIIKKHIDSISGKKETFIIGGDFNALPPFTKQTRWFDDSACSDGYEADDYSAETDWMVPFFLKYESATWNEYCSDNAKHFTHTTDKNGFWNRKIDYILSNKEFVKGSGQTLQQWMQVSDHAPIVAKFHTKQYTE